MITHLIKSVLQPFLVKSVVISSYGTKPATHLIHTTSATVATCNINKINNLYLPSAMFIALVLVGPSKQLKQKIQTEHNTVKNPNWPEANQLAVYNRGGGFELGATKKQIQVVARANPGPLDCESDTLTTWPRYLLTCNIC